LLTFSIELDLFGILVLSSVGFIISFIGGMVGLVLGVLRLPFILSTGISVTESVGTNIGVSTLGAITASIQHLRNNNISISIFLIMAITGSIGAFFGALLTKNIPIDFFVILVAVIIFYESVILLKENKNRKVRLNLEKKTLKQNPYYDVVLESIIGFLVGLLGGLVGLVLGSIRLPVMIKILKTEPKIAVGTNMVTSAIMGTFGFIGHVVSNEVNLVYLIILGPSAMIGGFLGARYTNRLSPTTLKKLIGIVLAIVAVVIFLSQILELNIFFFT
jgi:uncharacterized protein